MKSLFALCLAVATPAFAVETRLPNAPNAASLNPLATIKLQALSETRNRPLFSPNRRPPPPAIQPPLAPDPVVAAVKPQASEPPPFDLIGVVVGGDTRFVLLASHGNSSVKRLRIGDERDGWRVDEINIRSVVLQRDGHEESLALASHSAAPTATPEPEVAERDTNYSAMTPGPVRDEYRRLMKHIAAKR